MKKNKIIIPLLVLAAFLLGAAWSYLVIRQLNGNTIFTSARGGENYTINENSISAAVDKVYDATVVVASYKNGVAVSTGTGFVYKTDGNTAYIMTNNHVVSSGDSAKVIFSDSSSSDTKILGGDAYADIAVLIVSTSSIKQVATIGSSESMNLGDTVFTVGAPLGDNYSGTVTKGILSGKDRLVEVSVSSSASDYYMKVLQTDAALNPGNSGGPLCNVNGEVVGVNSLKLTEENSATRSYSVEGMGFAIPIEDAIYYAEKIEQNEPVKRPYLGVSMLDLTNSYYLWQAGITLPEGVKEGVAIVEVVDNSPASRSGLQKGDIITKIGDIKVSSVSKLRYELYKYEPGTEIDITFNRNGEENETKVILEESNN